MIVGHAAKGSSDIVVLIQSRGWADVPLPFVEVEAHPVWLE